MQVPILNVPEFMARGAAAQSAVDRAIARADLLNLVKHAHDELVVAKLNLTDAQHALREFDQQTSSPYPIREGRAPA